jgi:hypothetical protein
MIFTSWLSFDSLDDLLWYVFGCDLRFGHGLQGQHWHSHFGFSVVGLGTFTMIFFGGFGVVVRHGTFTKNSASDLCVGWHELH